MAYLTSGRNKIMGSSVSTDANVVTVIDENSTDEQVPSALAVHTAIQNVSAGVPTNAYTKDEVDDLLDDKANVDDLVESYSKDEVDNLLNDKANVTDTYNKTEIDALLDGKANTDDVTTNGYTKEEVDNLLANKADSSAIVDSYTKDEVDDLLTGKADTTALDNYVLSDELDDYALTSSVYNKTEVDDLLTAKVNTTSVVTRLSSTNVDEEIPSAKAVYDAIQNVSAGVPADVYSKTDVDDLLADKADIDDLVDAYSKTEVDTLLDDKANVDDIIDAYTKEEVDNLLDSKVGTDDLVDSYSKDEVDNLLDGKADSSAIIDSYTKEEVNTLLDGKVSTDDVIDAYSKTEVDNLLNAKADTDDLIDAYSKTEVDGLLASKADSSAIIDAYTKTEVNDLLDSKADSSSIIDAYNKTEVDDLLADKVNVDDLVDSYSKTEVDGLLADKADSADIVDAYTKGEVDTLLTGKADSDDLNNVYTKEEVNNLLDGKVGTDDVIDAYSKTEVDDLLTAKADTTALNNYVTNGDLTSTLSNYADIPSVSETFNNFSTYVDNTYATKTSVATNTDNIASIITRIAFFQNPNLLINCSFHVNDYNVTSVPSNNTSVVYLVNRWATTSKGLSCSVPSANILRLLASSGCTGLSVFQILENRDALTNAAALTFSFWARAVGTNSIGKRVIGRIGSGGGNTGETEIRLTNDWQFVSSTRLSPYFGSKSDGGVFISAPDITTEGSGFEITNVKLEFGYDVSPYVPRLYSEDLALCQRYYQKWDGISHTDVPLGNFSVGTGDICPILHLPVPMRTTPRIKSTLTDVELYGCNTARTDYEAYEPTHLSIYSMSNNAVTLRCRSNGTFAVGSSGIFRIKFGQQYKFILDAELYE